MSFTRGSPGGGGARYLKLSHLAQKYGLARCREIHEALYDAMVVTDIVKQWPVSVSVSSVKGNIRGPW